MVHVLNRKEEKRGLHILASVAQGVEDNVL